jgi:hypothetical protein
MASRSETMTPHPVRRFLRQASRFAILLLLINALLYVGLIRPHVRAYQKLPFAGSILLADSHGMAIADLTEAAGVANWSAAGDAYTDMERKLQYALRIAGVDRVFIAVDDHGLAPYREVFNNERWSIVFKTFGDQPRQGRLAYFYARWVEHYVVLLNPAYRDRIYLSLSARVQAAFHQRTGQGRKAWPQQTAAERQQAIEDRYWTQFSNNYTSAILQQSLLRMIQACRQNGVAAIGIRFPIHPAYRDRYAGRAYGADSVWRAEGLPILDYTYLFDDQDSCFQDPDHLSDKGAELLVAQWASDLGPR